MKIKKNKKKKETIWNNPLWYCPECNKLVAIPWDVIDMFYLMKHHPRKFNKECQDEKKHKKPNTT